MEQWTGSKLGKEYDKAVIITLPISFTCTVYHTECGLAESQAGIKIAEININILRYADDTTLMAGSEEELKSLLMGGSETQHQKSRKVPEIYLLLLY